MLVLDNIKSLETASKVSELIKGSHVEKYILNNDQMYKVVQDEHGQMQIFSFRLPNHLIKYIKNKSRENNMSCGQVIRKIIENNLIQEK